MQEFNMNKNIYFLKLKTIYIFFYFVLTFFPKLNSSSTLKFEHMVLYVCSRVSRGWEYGIGAK